MLSKQLKEFIVSDLLLHDLRLVLILETERLILNDGILQFLLGLARHLLSLLLGSHVVLLISFGKGTLFFKFEQKTLLIYNQKCHQCAIFHN